MNEIAINAAVLARLKAAVGPKGFSEDQTEIAPHLEERRKKYHGRSPLLLKPTTTAEVSAILAICNETRTPIVAQGGNTGLVGAQMPFHGEVLLSTARLNRIRARDAEGETLVAEAGVVLAEVQRAADEMGLLFPVSLAAEGSCTIGGILSTNAGGVNVLRYGMARASVLGIEVVRADGTVLEMLRTLLKDNTGYDLKQIFIGAEGTLGIITAAALRLYPKPAASATALAQVENPHAAVRLLGHMEAGTGGLLNAFELIARSGIELVTRHIPGARDPFARPAPWYVLMEASGGNGVAQLFEDALGGAMASGLASDVVVAANRKQAAELWQLRESLSEAQTHEGGAIRHDISVPIAAIPDFIERGCAAVIAAAPGARPVIFGHLGDGNLHFNFSAPKPGPDPAFLARWEEIQFLVHDVVREFSGSISAEHGIGIMKRDQLRRYKSSEELDAMRALKSAFDPNGILNPGKVIPPVLKL